METAQPDQVIVSPTFLTDAQREEAESNLKEAYARFDASYEKFIVDIASVRAAERVLNPCDFAKPAVLAMAVSAPCTTWSTHQFSAAPFPKFVSAIHNTFKACYTNEDSRANRLKVIRKYQKGKQQN